MKEVQILRALWESDISRSDEPPKSAAYRQIRRDFEQRRKSLEAQLENDQCAALGKLLGIQYESVSLELEDAFFKGCRLGGRLMLALMTEEENDAEK